MPVSKSKTRKKTKPAAKSAAVGLSYDAKTIITVFLLVTAYPIGIILMFLWMDWPTWLKVLVVSPILVLGAASLMAIFALSAFLL